MSAIATGRGCASRLVGRGPFNRCCCSIGPRCTTDSCYRGFHPAGPSGLTEGLHLPPPSYSSEADEKHERDEGWERVGRKSFTNLASCQEQEDPAHPFLLLSLGRERAIPDARRRAARGCQRILAILFVREEERRRCTFLRSSYSHHSFFFFFIYIR